MTACLELPTPRDDRDGLGQAIRLVESAASALAGQSNAFWTAGETASRDWIGPAAQRFVISHAHGHQVLDRVQRAHYDLQAVLAEYERELGYTHDEVDRAHRHIVDELGRFHQDLMGAVSSLADHVGSVISEIASKISDIVDDVMNVLKHGVSGLEQVLGIGHSVHNELSSWAPKFVEPAIRTLGGPLIAPVLPSPAQIYDELKAAGHFVTPLVESGIHSLISAGHSVLSGGLNVLHGLEQGIASAIHTAHTWIVNAFHKLLEVGRSVARAVSSRIDAFIAFDRHLVDGVVHYVESHVADTLVNVVDSAAVAWRALEAEADRATRVFQSASQEATRLLHESINEVESDVRRFKLRAWGIAHQMEREARANVEAISAKMEQFEQTALGKISRAARILGAGLEDLKQLEPLLEKLGPIGKVAGKVPIVGGVIAGVQILSDLKDGHYKDAIADATGFVASTAAAVAVEAGAAALIAGGVVSAPAWVPIAAGVAVGVGVGVGVTYVTKNVL